MRNVTGSSKAFYTRVVYRGEAEDGPMKFSRYDVDILDEKGNVVDTMSDYRMIVTEKLEEDKRFK